MPTTRSGWLAPLTIAVTSIDDVLVASTHPVETIVSLSCANSAHLPCSYSVGHRRLDQAGL